MTELVQPQRLKVIDVVGDGSPAGIAYGRAAGELISSHLTQVTDRITDRKRVERSEIASRIDRYRTKIHSLYPDIGHEIDGIAQGAEISYESAWLLQLRAEANRPKLTDLPPECTSFGATGSATKDGTTIIGHNGDLPAFYQDLLVLVRRRRENGPDYMTLTPAGQLAWQGINDHGLMSVSNFLYSGDWLSDGVPRYLFTRIALDQSDAQAAAAHLQQMRRASPRNMLLGDENTLIDVELASGDSDRSGVVKTEGGIIVHANHHITNLRVLEEAPPERWIHSFRRQRRLEALLLGREIDVDTAKEVLQDRVISRELGDDEGSDNMTIASTVADIGEQVLYIALGPPHLSQYHSYSLKD